MQQILSTLARASLTLSASREMLLDADTTDTATAVVALLIGTVLNVSLCLLLRRTLSPDRSTTFFAWHSLVNALIVFLCAPDVVSSLRSPLTSLLRPYSLLPTVVQISFHVAHMVLDWRHLAIIDWVHHLLSSVLVGFLNVAYVYGPLLNYCMAFATGLPGGIDYAMLTAVKLGKLAPGTEKRVNGALNQWCRMPFILHWMGIATCCHSGGLFRGPMPPLILGLQFVLIAGNSLFFAERVVANHATHAQKVLANQKQNGKDKNGAGYIATGICLMWCFSALVLPFFGDHVSSNGVGSSELHALVLQSHSRSRSD